MEYIIEKFVLERGDINVSVTVTVETALSVRIAHPISLSGNAYVAP